MFILRKSIRWSNRYGFVRFYDGKNVGKLEKELDYVTIGLMKLHVNLPKYRKGDTGRRKEEFVLNHKMSKSRLVQNKYSKQICGGFALINEVAIN